MFCCGQGRLSHGVEGKGGSKDADHAAYAIHGGPMVRLCPQYHFLLVGLGMWSMAHDPVTCVLGSTELKRDQLPHPLDRTS